MISEPIPKNVAEIVSYYPKGILKDMATVVMKFNQSDSLSSSEQYFKSPDSYPNNKEKAVGE